MIKKNDAELNFLTLTGKGWAPTFEQGNSYYSNFEVQPSYGATVNETSPGSTYSNKNPFPKSIRKYDREDEILVSFYY